MNNDSIFLSIGLWSLFFSAITLFAFRKKLVNIFDPLSLFLVMRMSTLLTATLIIALTTTLDYKSLLYFLSVFLFVVVFYLSSKNIKPIIIDISNKQINFLNAVAFSFLLLKITLIITSEGSLPIFSPGGSDASIEFNESNKVSTSLLFGLGSGELFIFAFTIPLINRKIFRYLAYFAIVISIMLIMSSGKKSSLFVVGSTIFFADGFRSLITHQKKLYFFTKKNVILLIAISFTWAIWVFLNTSVIDTNSNFDFSLFLFILDFAFSQWVTPYFIFNSPEFFDFLNNYKVNEFTYFFHSILKPLGFPAFDASIGPALHQYQTGDLSGNGINPSFILEGYVLLGAGLPIYSIIVALLIAKARNKLLAIRNIEHKIIFITLYLNSIYALVSDALFFAKGLWASIIVFIIIIIPLRLIFFRKI